MAIADSIIANDVQKELIEYLSQFLLEKRLTLFYSILRERTRYITIAMEDIYQSQNASAVIRSCECFGVQDVHIIENTNKFNINPKVALGAAKWLNLHKYNKKSNNSPQAIQTLREKGYRIVGTSPHLDKPSPEDFDIEKGPFALLIGNELSGLSPFAMNEAEEYIRIPTVGFTESLNLSVSTAVCIHTLTNRLRKSSIEFRLTGHEQDLLLLQWLRASIKSVSTIEKRFLQGKGLF